MIPPAWARNAPWPLAMMLGLSLAAMSVEIAPAAAVDGAYCIVNRADRAFQIDRGSSFETLAPGRKACCTDNCRPSVAIGFDVSRDPDLKQFLLQLGLKLLARGGGGSAPSGQPIVGGGWVSICFVHWRQGDQIEVYSPGDAWRCDVVDRGGALRETIAATGRREAEQTALRVCNYANDGPAYVVKAWSGDGGGWISDGWYAVQNGTCEDLPLPAGYRGNVYAYAQTENLSWPGEWNLCVDPGESFEIRDADRSTCGWRYKHYPFFEQPVDGRGAEVILSPE